MNRYCPFCSRRPEDVTLHTGEIHCCPNCSIAWRAGVGTPAGHAVNTRPRAELLCPDCADRVLIPMGVTAGNEQWKCIACHGRLVRVAAASVSPPPQPSSSDGSWVGSTVQILAYIAEAILSIA